MSKQKDTGDRTSGEERNKQPDQEVDYASGEKAKR
jgi:hypothetical protein